LDVVVSVSVIEHVRIRSGRLGIRKVVQATRIRGALCSQWIPCHFRDTLWNFSEGKQVEDPASMGQSMTLREILSETGFVVDSVEHRDWLPLTKNWNGPLQGA